MLARAAPVSLFYPGHRVDRRHPGMATPQSGPSADGALHLQFDERLHSTAYSIGKVRVIGSMKPFTIMLMAGSPTIPAHQVESWSRHLGNGGLNGPIWASRSSTSM